MCCALCVTLCVWYVCVCVRESSQDGVLSLQLLVFLLKFSDLFPQKLHLLSDRQCQVTLYQVLHTHTHTNIVISDSKVPPSDSASRGRSTNQTHHGLLYFVVDGQQVGTESTMRDRQVRDRNSTYT